MGVEVHHGPAIGAGINGPTGQARAIGVAAASEVRPILLHEFAELAVFRMPRSFRLGIELAENEFDFSRVVRAERRRARLGRWNGLVEAVAVDRLLAGFALGFNPGPGGKCDEAV